MNKVMALFATVTLLAGFSGCRYAFYPRANDYVVESSRSNSVETVLNLTTMMEESAEVSKGETGNNKALDDLHN